jgi:hypothetical protein
MSNDLPWPGNLRKRLRYVNDMASSLRNVPAAGIPYFTPAQIPAAGTAADPQSSGKPIPKLFQPIKIRGVEFHNRIFV